MLKIGISAALPGVVLVPNYYSMQSQIQHCEAIGDVTPFLLGTWCTTHIRSTCLGSGAECVLCHDERPSPHCSLVIKSNQNGSTELSTPNALQPGGQNISAEGVSPRKCGTESTARRATHGDVVKELRMRCQDQRLPRNLCVALRAFSWFFQGSGGSRHRQGCFALRAVLSQDLCGSTSP